MNVKPIITRVATNGPIGTYWSPLTTQWVALIIYPQKTRKAQKLNPARKVVTK